MRALLSVILIIALLGVASSGLCQSTKVIGKVIIPANVQVILLLADSGQVFGAIAFEEQTFYVIEKAVDKDGTTVLGYITAPENFKHTCQAHGLEILKSAVVMITQKMIDPGVVKLELFHQ